jgi:hypothetical protein
LFVDLDNAKLLYTEANYKKALQEMLGRSMVRIVSARAGKNAGQTISSKDIVEIQ